MVSFWFCEELLHFSSHTIIMSQPTDHLVLYLISGNGQYQMLHRAEQQNPQPNNQPIREVFFSSCQLAAHLCLIKWAFLISNTFCYPIILILQLFSTTFYELKCIGILDTLLVIQLIHYLFQRLSCSSTVTCYFTLAQWGFVLVVTGVGTWKNLNEYHSWMYKGCSWAGCLDAGAETITLNPNWGLLSTFNVLDPESSVDLSLWDEGVIPSLVPLGAIAVETI